MHRSRLDDYVGRLLKTLEEVGQLDNTIIVYAGDNGYFLGDHGRFEKMTPHEESVRIPLLIRYPAAIKPGTVSDAIVRNIDVAPTLYDLTGLKGPATLDGRSLRESLIPPTERAFPWTGRRRRTSNGRAATGRSSPARRGTCSAAVPGQGQNRCSEEGRSSLRHQPDPDLAGVRTQTHKYAVYFDGDLSELYDLRSDPTEAHNLIGDPAQKELIATLHQRLLQLADATHDPLRPLISAEPTTRGASRPRPCSRSMMHRRGCSVPRVGHPHRRLVNERRESFSTRVG